MACGQRDADDGEHDADDLQRPHAQPEEGEIGKHDDDRDGRLLDRDVDGGRVVERGVEDDVEDGEAGSAEAGKQFPVAAYFGQSSRSVRQPTGSRISTAMTQRRNTSVIGETWPTASLPATELPPHNSMVDRRNR